MFSLNHPRVPFESKIPKLHHGSLIIVAGKINQSHPRRFFVDLACRRDVQYMQPDIAFHISCRFDEQAIVRNTFYRGEWQKEERAIPCFPLKAGQPFEILILVQHDHFKIAANQRHLSEYKRRLPHSDVDSISIDGDIMLTKVEFTEQCPTSIPFPFPVAPSVPAMPVVPSCPAITSGRSRHPRPIRPVPASSSQFYNPPVPFVARIPGEGLRPGLTLIVSGRPNLNADRFGIDFQEGSSEHSMLIALHFNPRFEEKFRSIVRNTMMNGQWGTEENLGGLPLECGVDFQIVFRVVANRFVITINGNHFTEYYHRVTALSRINFIRIYGPLMLNFVQFV